MKIYNLSYNNKELFEEVYTITGKPFGFFHSLRKGGTGSPPLCFYNAPTEVMKILNQNADRKYSNIEVLSRGIIIRFKSRLENYGIPLKLKNIGRIRFVPYPATEENDFDELLEISVVDGTVFQFKIKPYEKPGLIRFFKKDFFDERLIY